MKKTILTAVVLALFSTEAFAANENQQYAQLGEDYEQSQPIGSSPYKGRTVPRINKARNARPETSAFYFTLEYSAPRLSDNNKSGGFRTNVFEKQIKDLENIALGMSFRLNRFIGFNANWEQTELNAEVVNGQAQSEVARFNMDHYNFSGLAYLPVVENYFDVFAELGAAVLSSKLHSSDASGNSVKSKSNRIASFYGVGFQLSPFANCKDALRFSYQKYSGNLLTGNEYSTIRLGYLKAF